MFSAIRSNIGALKLTPVSGFGYLCTTEFLPIPGTKRYVTGPPGLHFSAAHEPLSRLTAHATSHQVERCFLVHGRSPSLGVVELVASLHMPKDLVDQPRLLDASDDPQGAAAMGTGFDVNGEHLLEDA